jgi:hypothetical protein
MKLVASLTLVASLATFATAQPAPPRPQSVFATATSFSACTESWAFMCHIPSPNGYYGTARKMQHCTTYAFAPDGTYTITGDMPRIGHGGTYRIVGPRVILTQQNVDGTTEKTEMPLSKERDTLGTLSRVP